MSNNFFRFKQFVVEQNEVSMRVNTDGVLLGAWFSLPEQAEINVLDVGCGTGVIALMACQRLAELKKRFKVDAVDIDEPSCIQAVENFSSSPWAEHLRVFALSFCNFAESSKTQYDIVVSNPPFFNNSLKNAIVAKRVARHTDTLNYRELIESSIGILAPKGSLVVILPLEESSLFKAIAQEKGLCLFRACRVFSKRGDLNPKRLMMEYRLLQEEKNTEARITENLCIMDENLQFTPEYKELTGDFYLKF